MSYFKTVPDERRARAAAATKAHHRYATTRLPSETFDWDRALAGMHEILDAHSRACRRDRDTQRRKANT